MCICRRYIDFPICEFFDFRFGFFEASCKRLHDRILRVLQASARSALTNSAELERTCKECTPEGFTDSKEASELLNTLEEELCKGRHGEETELLKVL